MQLKAKNLNLIFKNFVFGQSRVLIEHIFFGDKPKSAAGVKPLGGKFTRTKLFIFSPCQLP